MPRTGTATHSLASPLFSARPNPTGSRRPTCQSQFPSAARRTLMPKATVSEILDLEMRSYRSAP
jgi:hypothetical protein